ncbi:MAG TPA: nucleic acid-binding protein [Methanophagales archaeon]|nr:nucleic acid-binding protein [Methanophagales archaeon]
MIFIDTGAWIALEDVNDKNHAMAVKLREELKKEKERFITTSYILDETYTFLLINIGYEKALYFHNRIQRMEQSGILEIIHISEEIEEESWTVFERFNRDKKWSFTDCTSKVVMDLLRIEEVFTFDFHFEQMGFVRKP